MSDAANERVTTKQCCFNLQFLQFCFQKLHCNYCPRSLPAFKMPLQGLPQAKVLEKLVEFCEVERVETLCNNLGMLFAHIPLLLSSVIHSQTQGFGIVVCYVGSKYVTLSYLGLINITRLKVGSASVSVLA